MKDAHRRAAWFSIAASIAALLITVPVAAGAACRSKKEVEAVVHLLNRGAFGPTAGEVERICAIGREAWIEEQLHPETISDPGLASRLAIYTALTMSTAELLASYPEQEGEMRDPATSPGRVLAELTAALVTRAVHGRAQLEEVLVDFWVNHFSVYAPEGPTRWSIMAYVRDAIRPHVLGHFQDLLGATAESPAMLYYLDNYVNYAEGSRGRASGINENYARESLELHTLGVDGGYTQEDIIAAARVFTGWTITPPRTGTIDFVFVPRLHDQGAKTVLGASIGSGGIEEGYELIELLANHPSTARFISTKLAARLVADDPPEEIVAQAVQVFEQTGGDLRAVVGAILTARDFDKKKVQGVKVKTPFEFVASSLRAVNAEVNVGVSAARLVDDLGQGMLRARPPTGWADGAAKVVSSGGMLSRFNAAYRIAAGLLEGVRVDTNQWDAMALERHGSDDILEEILQQRARGGTRRALRKAAHDGADPVLLAAIALSSPEFQQQ